MLRLAGPVVVVQVGMMAMGVVDTIMVGRVSAQALAAVALGNVYLFAVASFGIGTLMALDPVVAQAVGADDHLGITRGLQRGLVLAVALSVPASLLLLPAAPVFRVLRQAPEIVPDAAGYAMVQAGAVVPFFLFIALRQTMQAMHRIAPIVLTITAANLANVFLNWVFVFGHMGLPPMGAVGSSWATAVSRWIMALGLLALSWPCLRTHLLPWRRDAFQWRPVARMLALGAPIGAQHQLEYGIFGVVALLMGSISAVAVAGHQVAIILASFTFMVPLGVSAAAAVLVGNAVGRGDMIQARRSAAAALVVGLSFMVVSAGGMIAAPDFLARVYTDKGDVITVAAMLIPLAGLFQVFDGLQVVSIGILRGLADTRAPMMINIVGFWLLGLPVSAYLGFRTGLGPRGLWWGLVAGLAVVAVTLLLRVRSRLAGTIPRIVIDGAPGAAP